MKVGRKELTPKLRLSTIGRYASKKGVPLTKLEQLLNNLTLDDFVELFVFACTTSGEEVTVDDVYNEMDERPDMLVELANYISVQLSGEGQPVKAGKKKATA